MKMNFLKPEASFQLRAMPTLQKILYLFLLT